MKHTYKTYGNLAAKVSRISWGAIFAGTLTALVVVAMLNLLGLGIGLSTIDPMTENNPLKGLGTGALIWFGLSNLIALFTGGLVAGRMSGYTSKSDGGLHGFLSWALFALVSFFLMTSAVGTMVNGMSSAVASVFSESKEDKVKIVLQKAQQKGEAETSISYNEVKNDVFQLINKAEKYNVVPDETSEKAREVFNKSEKSANQVLNDLNLDRRIDDFFNDLSFDLDDNGDLNITIDGENEYLNKEKLKNYITENTQLSDTEIEGFISKWESNIQKAIDRAEQFYAKAKVKAIEYSDKAADAMAKTSIATFITFLLGTLAGFFGGTFGSPSLTVTEERDEKK